MKNWLFLCLVLVMLNEHINAQFAVPGGVNSIANSGAGKGFVIYGNGTNPTFTFNLCDGDEKNTFMSFHNGDHPMSINGDGSIGFGIYKSNNIGYFSDRPGKYGALLKFDDIYCNGMNAKFEFRFVETTSTNTCVTKWLIPLEVNRNGLIVRGNSELFGNKNKIFGNNDSLKYYMGHYNADGIDGLDIHWQGGIKLGDRTGDVLTVYNGNFGIGTTKPEFKLDLLGTIRAWAIKVNTNKTADFVFEENYLLPSLSDVELFVQRNKHLPNIPSRI